MSVVFLKDLDLVLDLDLELDLELDMDMDIDIDAHERTQHPAGMLHNFVFVVVLSWL